MKKKIIKFVSNLDVYRGAELVEAAVTYGS